MKNEYKVSALTESEDDLIYLELRKYFHVLWLDSNWNSVERCIIFIQIKLYKT